MSRKMIFALSVLVLVGAMSGAGYADIIQITLGQSYVGTASASNTGATLNNVTGYAYQGNNSGTFTIPYLHVTGTGCNVACTLTGAPVTLTVKIGADTLVGTLTLTQEALSRYLEGSFLITSSTAGFATTGYAVGQSVVADLVVTNRTHAISSGQLETDAVPEPGTIAMMGSGLLALAGALRRKL